MSFNQEHKPINLGGASSTVSREQALAAVRLQRINRLDQENARKRNEAAIELQAFWRRIRAQKTQCRLLFDADPSTLIALWSLNHLPGDVARMHVWSTTMIKDDDGLLLLKRLASDKRSSWLILIRRLAPRLLKFMANMPESPFISTHLQLMTIWLNLTNERGMGADLSHSQRSSAVSYMLRAGYYESLSKVIIFARKSFTSLPILMRLIIFPLRLLHAGGLSDRDSYLKAIHHFTIFILPIPELTSRLKIPILKRFAVDIGLFLASLEPLFPLIESQTTLHSSIHSLSNLMRFMPPRYSQLLAPSYDAYLRLLNILLHQVPEAILQGSDSTESKDTWADFFKKTCTMNAPINLDSGTQNRMKSILTSQNICSLLKAADSSSKLLSLATYLPQFCWSWPSQVRNALDALATSDSARFASLLYAEKVSNILLGKTPAINPVILISSLNPEHWATLLFFTDLLLLSTQQMNDEAFYATTTREQTEFKLRNPLEVAQLQMFLKQLCTIVYILDHLPATGILEQRGRIDWGPLTARLKDSLLILYCREVRRPLPRPQLPEFMTETIRDDLDDEEAQWAEKRDEVLESFLKSSEEYVSPKKKILESDPSSFEEITALQDSVPMFRYFPWPERMPRELLFPHLLGDFYLIRFERTEDQFNSPHLPHMQQHRQWMRDPCNQILRCYEEALNLAWSDYPAKADLLQKLAFMLLWRFAIDSKFEDFQRAFDYLQHAFELNGSLPSLNRTIRIGWWFFDSFDHISGMLYLGERSTSRPNQSHIFYSTFYSGGNISHPIDYEKLAREIANFGDHPVISRVILAIRQNADNLTPHGLETLARWYLQLYKCRERSEDLDNAIATQTYAFARRTEARDEDKNDALDVAGVDTCGHQLALWLKLRYEVLHTKEDLEHLRNLLEQLVMVHAHPAVMFECAVLFSLLPSTTQLPYALYDRAIVALHSLQALSLGVGVLDMMLRFHDPTQFIGNIAAMALQDNNLVKALEWLENSRCLIWNQLSSLDEAAVWLDPERRGLAQNKISFRMMEAVHQGVLKHTYVYGDQILCDLTDGPVILLNASKLGCDALVYRPNAGPQRLPLTYLSYDQLLSWEKAYSNLLSDLGANVRGEERKDRPSKRNRSSVDDDLRQLLEEIWVALVEPVVDFVWDRKDLLPTSEKGPLPRLWWYRTGPFSLLPIHAAGLYTLNDAYGPQVRLSDFVVSSYVASLSSAISRPPTGPLADFKLLVIAQASYHHLPPLPGATEEVSNIKKHAKSLSTVVLTDEEATRAAVKEEAASAPWVHAACHGMQKGTRSSFLLTDGPLTINQLSSLPNLPKAEFAFLSACETATGDSDMLNEALHLAGGLHRLGYRSVVATMFSVRDRDAPFVADKVYEQLFIDERPDYKKAAHALHRAIHLLQEKNGRGNFRTWVPFIHIGM